MFLYELDVLQEQYDEEEPPSASRQEEHANQDMLRPPYNHHYGYKYQTEELEGRLMPIS